MREREKLMRKKGDERQTEKEEKRREEKGRIMHVYVRGGPTTKVYRHRQVERGSGNRAPPMTKSNSRIRQGTKQPRTHDDTRLSYTTLPIALNSHQLPLFLVHY